ncbi:hypothetical protein [Dysgonomonas termitidis]|uniref:Lipocalin-like domain-containing protein n=1 Tax=Dysgonomonas termitidis TaxID=1516126 RepID=A0ABV9KWN9_9BACT
MSKRFCSVMIAMVIVSFASCDSRKKSNEQGLARQQETKEIEEYHDEKLVGFWKRAYNIVMEDGRKPYNRGPQQLQLWSDGEGSADGYPITWSVTKGRLKYSDKSGMIAWMGKYKVDNTHLITFDADGGPRDSYKKQ